MEDNMNWLYSAADLEQAVLKTGFLPFFQSDIPEFSIEEFTPAEYWFADGVDGPWEWKSPVARNGNCAYGKLFRGKAGFVSMEWFPELVNYRRATYPLDADPTDKSRLIYDAVVRHESLLSKEIKTLCGFRKPRCRNFNRGRFMKNSNGKNRMPDSRRLSPVCKWERGLSWQLLNMNMISTAILTVGALPVTLRPKLCSGKI
jgi:hypothetical protein